ncbi:hypothetical protein CQA53_03900 [Helicobacter didelphidarum]|uniref:SPOR domain-containing protein n=1 Tax=Helicobacter didelphidarum TaxID=2040648 RepID=A0A3D8IP47_9HELI|nr:SPOR domain-containing protein [Helicobacter didelphidarum]RDU66371.1 hypothetical protein CQA53_03900 [Helicobacter didelphidarum]
MKNNSNVNDIFQNDNNSKNKTKTILLLTIVMIILIAVFLIIAWVMTRDNPIQTIAIEDTGKNNLILNESPNSQKPIPYAHNTENATPNPTLADSANNQLGLDLDSQNPHISLTPPVGVDADSKNVQPNFPPLSINTSSQTPLPNYEEDKQYQNTIKDLQKKHEEKGNGHNQVVANNQKQPPQDEIKIPQKVIVSSAPQVVSTPISDLPKQVKKPEEVNKPIKKQEQVQSASGKKPETNAGKPLAQTSAQDNVIQRPAKPTDSKQGTTATKGHYIQVGAFSLKPEAIFLNKISKYSYRIESYTDNEGKTVTRYLIGPYKDKQDATRNLQNIRTEILPSATHKEIK